ncbi:MAG: hypothetical protein Q7R53_01325 [bacterium]|nr:hypothetical protein [bacterium]
MKKHFYSHIVDSVSINIELNQMQLSIDEKNHLIQIIDSNIHLSVVDTVLSELAKEDKKTFLKHLSEDNHEKIWQLLKEKTENIENKIKKSTGELKQQIIKEMKELKKKK